MGYWLTHQVADALLADTSPHLITSEEIVLSVFKELTNTVESVAVTAIPENKVFISVFSGLGRGQRDFVIGALYPACDDAEFFSFEKLYFHAVLDDIDVVFSLPRTLLAKRNLVCGEAYIAPLPVRIACRRRRAHLRHTLIGEPCISVKIPSFEDINIRVTDISMFGFGAITSEAIGVSVGDHFSPVQICIDDISLDASITVMHCQFVHGASIFGVKMNVTNIEEREILRKLVNQVQESSCVHGMA